MEFLVAGRDNNSNDDSEDLIGLIKETRQVLKSSLLLSNFDELKKAIKELMAEIDKFLRSKELIRHNPAKNSAGYAGQAELKSLKNSLEIKFDIIKKELEKLEEREVKIAANLEGFNKKFQKAFELVESKRKELRELDGNKNKIIFEGEKLNLKFQDLEDQLRQIGKTTNNLQPTTNDQQLSSHELSEIERKMFKLRTELAAIGEIDEFLIKEAREVEAHYNFLTNQSQDLEKAIIDLKNLIKELSEKIHFEFNASLKSINDEFNKFFKLMFGGGNARLRIKNYAFANGESPKGLLRIKNDEAEDEKNEDKNGNNEERELKFGLEIDLSLPKKRITSLEMLSGGEKSLVSIAALFALISISPPPFLVLDEIDAALDEDNSQRFANLIKEFSKKTQFIVVTHNRAVMEVANALYGITVGKDGTSKVLSLKLDTKP